MRLLDSSSRLQCQYPLRRSNLEKVFAVDYSGSMSSIIGNGCISRFSALFKACGSMHTRISPFFFKLVTIRLTQAVGLCRLFLLCSFQSFLPVSSPLSSSSELARGMKLLRMGLHSDQSSCELLQVDSQLLP